MATLMPRHGGASWHNEDPQEVGDLVIGLVGKDISQRIVGILVRGLTRLFNRAQTRFK